MSERLRFGLVGLGNRGFRMAKLIREHPALELVALADAAPALLEMAQEPFPEVRQYASGAELCGDADVQAVLIATGDRMHAQNAREALLGGKHALIEKPLAQSFRDLEAIVRLQRETGLTVGTCLELRYAPLYQRARQIVDSGELGSLHAAVVLDHVGRDKAQFFARERTRAREAVVSLVLQKGVHSLDLLNWLMGDSPRRLGAVGALRHFGGQRPGDLRCPQCPEQEACPHAVLDPSFEPVPGLKVTTGDNHCVWSDRCDVEDVSLLNLEYLRGAVASYNEVHFSPHSGITINLFGDRARMEVECDYDRGEMWVEVTARYARERRREDVSGDLDHGEADEALLADFAAAVREGREPLANLRAGFESAILGIGTRLSLDRRSFVDLPSLSSHS